MCRFLFEVEQKDGFAIYPPPVSTPSSVSSPYNSLNHEKESAPLSSPFNKISPVLLLVIVILAAIFFVSGLLHLLVRFLLKRTSFSPIYHSNRYSETSASHSLQRQLQQLFRLHDSGLDQAFVDALPVFYYKDIMGSKEPFDCAVCLCEFSGQERLRESPNGFSSEGESGSSNCQKSVTIVEDKSVGEKRVFSVRLGKFRSLNGGEGSGQKQHGETSRSNLDARRCYSLGAVQYVEGESNLQVALSHGNLNCRGRDKGCPSIDGDLEDKKIRGRTGGDSFSVSKIWLWSKKSRFPASSSSSTTHMDMFSSTPLAVGLPNNEIVRDI
ncbi:hypothetical protein OIU76_022162 [Salix suchowensis]|nr:hypothetical protein OIU76_022162 [Salix suchowensis]